MNVCPCPCDDEPHFVFFEIENFYNHAPMFGHLKTIKVWVATECQITVKSRLFDK